MDRCLKIGKYSATHTTFRFFLDSLGSFRASFALLYCSLK
ncbi:hypothetical protein LEP1GSC036_0125 [Leptospira weilii str. 2006001853]|uniref:Uncharacterized protein n=1 Tax=Leptospira weilii str. 2006001853 TaxID=1001589 RepID=A0A828YZ32_9LEPT|nr:hypothetical protein LEP1GSC036_0125 [Leptospira weilii str. 2006001853]